MRPAAFGKLGSLPPLDRVQHVAPQTALPLAGTALCCHCRSNLIAAVAALIADVGAGATIGLFPINGTADKTAVAASETNDRFVRFSTAANYIWAPSLQQVR